MRPASLFCLIVLVLVVLFPSDYELVLAYKITRINEGGFRHKKHVILIAAGSTGSSTPNLSSAASNKIASNNSYNMRNSEKRQLNSSTPLFLSQFPSNTTTNINTNAHNKTKSSTTTKTTTISSTTTTSNTSHSTTPTSPSSPSPNSNSHHTTTSLKTTSRPKSTSSSKSSSSSHSVIASSVPDTPVSNPASVGGNSPADNNDLTAASQNSSVSSISNQITPQQTGSLGSGSSPTPDVANSGSGSSDTQETPTSQPGNTNNQNFAPKGSAPDKLVGPVIGGVFGTIAGVGIVVLLAARHRRKCASLDSQNSSANWSDYDQLDPPVEPMTRFRPSSFLIAVRNAVNKLPRDSANITGQSKFVEKMDFESVPNGSQTDHFVDMK